MEAIRGNGSLLNDGGPYNTYDGETRSLNVSFTCNGTITELTFIALRGGSNGRGTRLEVQNPASGMPRSSANTANATKFRTFGYEMKVSMEFIAGDTLSIQYPVYSDSLHSLLYQPWDEDCRSLQNNREDCGWKSEQPLLAVKTGIIFFIVIIIAPLLDISWFNYNFENVFRHLDADTIELL